MLEQSIDILKFECNKERNIKNILFVKVVKESRAKIKQISHLAKILFSNIAFDWK